ncbi:MAG: SH3 domain-containing protein [Kiloniellales bacterium]|nr:SH3 domain-containing protein [Kiloniellales bacterium]
MPETAPSPVRPFALPAGPSDAPTRRQVARLAAALRLVGLLAALATLAVLSNLAALGPAQAQDEARLGPSGMALPRFVSLKSDEVNLRTGPGTRYPIDWIYRRRGLPVEVVDEFEDWRRVRDHDGTVGWVHRFMLTSRRTVVVVGGTRTLRREPAASAPGLAYLEPGVVANLKNCQAAWCRIEAQGFDGWIHRSEIYGTNADD